MTKGERNHSREEFASPHRHVTLLMEAGDTNMSANRNLNIHNLPTQPCVMCSDGIAILPASHCQLCISGILCATDAELYYDDLISAARTRIDRYYDEDEAIRLEHRLRGLEHRLEGVFCRRLQQILASSLDELSQANLIAEVDEIQSEIEVKYNYNITPKALHSAHVALGRYLNRQEGLHARRYQIVSDFDGDIYYQSREDCCRGAGYQEADKAPDLMN